MEYEPCLQDGKRPSIKKLSGPDGVEAWCVALAACLINFIMAGLGRMSGILFVAFIDIFQIGRKQASLPFSIRSSVRNLLGPVVGILGQKYGVRNVTLFGGIIGTISAASCFYAKDILWVTILWGCINGVGTSLTTTLPLVVIGQHFKKYRTTASGMAFSGGCVGAFLFPALLEFLLHFYGLGGTYLIIAGIIMHTIPAAMMLRKPTWLNKSRESIKIITVNNIPDITGNPIDEHSKITSPETAVESRNGVHRQLIVHPDSKSTHCDQISNDICGSISNLAKISVTETQIDVDVLRKNSDIVVEILTYGLNVRNGYSKYNVVSSIDSNDIMGDIEELYSKIEYYQSNRGLQFENTNRMCTESDLIRAKSDNTGNIHVENDLVLNHTKLKQASNTEEHVSLWLALKNIAVNKKDILAIFPAEKHDLISQILSELNNMFSVLEKNKHKSSIFIAAVATEDELITRNAPSAEDSSNTFFVHIKTALRLHLKPFFLLICLCRTVHFLMFMPVVTTIVDFSMDKGLLEEDGKYVIAALSLGDLVGRLCLGWITDRGYLSLPRYMLMVMVVQGASAASLSLMQSRASLMTAIAVFGLLQGSVFVRHPVLVSKYLGSQEQSIAMGCINFLSGLLGFVLPSYIGYFRDTIGSYNGIFYINGGIGAFVGLLWIFEPYLRKWSDIEDDEYEPSAV